MLGQGARGRGIQPSGQDHVVLAGQNVERTARSRWREFSVLVGERVHASRPNNEWNLAGRHVALSGRLQRATCAGDDVIVRATW